MPKDSHKPVNWPIAVVTLDRGDYYLLLNYLTMVVKPILTMKEWNVDGLIQKFEHNVEWHKHKAKGG